MISLKEEASVEFTGNVVATMDDYVIHADTVKIFLATDEEIQKNKDKDQNQDQAIKKSNRVKKVISTGNVRIESQGRKASADKAVYSLSEGTLVLTGNSPQVETGESFIKGETITLYRQSSQVIVKGSKERQVEAVFNPNDEM